MGRGRPLEAMEREMIALGIKKRMSSRGEQDEHLARVVQEQHYLGSGWGNGSACTVHHRYWNAGLGYTQQELDRVADELNNCPRQTLDWIKWTEAFNNLLLDLTT